jgi:hypothetical protein
VKNLSVSQANAPQPYLRAAKPMMAGASADLAAPIEAGEGQITVTVRGSIELID